jgi:hypothetical protein
VNKKAKYDEGGRELQTIENEKELAQREALLLYRAVINFQKFLSFAPLGL